MNKYLHSIRFELKSSINKYSLVLNNIEIELFDENLHCNNNENEIKIHTFLLKLDDNWMSVIDCLPTICICIQLILD